jgi:hypothetical protein
MEKEFVPYEQALALKELGFEEPCFFSYELDYEYFNRAYYNHINHNSHPKLVSAPLYQQAFRWFREKYNLDSFVKHLYKSTIKVGYYFGIDEYKGVEFQMDFDAWYDTYEEAELECLEKLIEIVKQK